VNNLGDMYVAGEPQSRVQWISVLYT